MCALIEDDGLLPLVHECGLANIDKERFRYVVHCRNAIVCKHALIELSCVYLSDVVVSEVAGINLPRDELALISLPRIYEGSTINLTSVDLASTRLPSTHQGLAINRACTKSPRSCESIVLPHNNEASRIRIQSGPLVCQALRIVSVVHDLVLRPLFKVGNDCNKRRRQAHSGVR